MASNVYAVSTEMNVVHIANGRVGQNSCENSDFRSSFNLNVNGKLYPVNLNDYPVDTTLNTFIREYANLTGTKFLCLEGGCGACICTISGKHPVSNKIQTWAANSCLTLLNTCDGWDITTIEGIGSQKNGYHPIQSTLARLNGTQCGYCTPGMVMNMYSLMESKNGNVSTKEVENSFGGNLCRCTGYRPILDAMKCFANDNQNPTKDIEDLWKKCSKGDKLCTSVCNKNKFRVIYESGEEWIQAKSLNDIFQVFNMIENQKYMLVAGNTAHGVFRRSSDIKIFIDINNVPELHSYTIKNDFIEIGANVNLTEAIDIFLKASKTNDFEYLEKIIEHMDLIANVPVRNMGTLAGNLSMKHEFNDFSSDLFLLFQTVGASVIIRDTERRTFKLSPREYLSVDMYKRIIVSIIFYPLPQKKFHLKTYKIMPRAQNAHAYVNAGFLLELGNNSVIQSSHLCFGGINPNFIHAKQTEYVLKGKKVFENKTIQEALSALKKELIPDLKPGYASPDYRNILACGLFYKFILSIAPKEKIKNIFWSGGNILIRPTSHGTQTYDTQKNNYPLTEPITKLESAIQCSGEAIFSNDCPNYPNQLWAAFVHSTQGNSKILKIDPSDALKLPGVFGFYSATDIPGKNSFVMLGMFGFEHDEEIFASEHVKFFGQPIGMIVALSSGLANNAAKKVKIEYGPIEETIVTTIKEVIENNAFHRLKNHSVRNPEISKPTKPIPKKGTAKITGFLELGSQYHFAMEPHTTICVPIEGGIEITSASQWMDLTQSVVANSLNMKKNSIFVKVRRLGGGFGGKISRNNQIACACAVACRLLNRPVRFVQTLESSMLSVGKRFSAYSKYEVDSDENGKIIGLNATIYENFGSNLNENPIDDLTLPALKNGYDFNENWKFDPICVMTDVASHTWCRAPGSLEGHSTIETIMEHIARATNRDPVDVRMANLPTDSKMRELLPEFVHSVDYRSRKLSIEKFNNENRWKKKGIGISIMEFPIFYFGCYPATVTIYQGDGTVAISHGGIEMGQGMNTKVAQVAAYILQIDYSMVAVRPSDSFVSGNSMMTGASITSESVCQAVKKACETLLSRMEPIRKTMENPKWKDIIAKCYESNINLVANQACEADGDLKGYNVWGVCCSEVEIDILTGNLIINRVDILEDTGESLNPAIDVGQIEGAFILGLGYWLTEQITYDDKTGEPLNTRTWNYKVPGAKDIPVDFRINLLQKSPNPNGFLRSKATGEPGVCLSISVIFALRHALESARMDTEHNGQWISLGAPSTPETITLLSGNTINKFTLN